MGRVMSLENELCLHFIPDEPGSHLGSRSAAGPVLQSIGLRPNMSNWTANGSKIYTDVSGIEVANAECATPEELLALDRANMEWLAKRLAGVDRLVLSRPNIEDPDARPKVVAGRVRVYKTNVSQEGMTVGTHENYQLFRHRLCRTFNLPVEETDMNESILYRMIPTLTPYLVTRQVFAGAGGLDFDQGTYLLSQRAMHMQNVIGPQTLSERGIINTRDEPLGDPGKYMRLHIICGDANMSEFATYLKTGVTSLVLKLIEEAPNMPRLALADPVREMHDVARDLTGKTHRLQLQDGRRYCALDIQQMYRDMIGKVVGHLSSADRHVFETYSSVIDLMRENDILDMHEYFDFALKHKLLQEIVISKGKDYGSREAAAVALKYHWIDEQGLFNRLEKKVNHRRITTDQHVDWLKQHAPNTRAAGRALLIQESRRDRVNINVDWHRFSYDGTSFPMPDPGNTYLSEARRFLEMRRGSFK